MSPEQARGQQPTLSSDVFVLGVIAFELLTGRRLFDQATQFDAASAVISWDRAALGRAPEVHGDWFDILHRALAPEPTERYENVRELLGDVEARFGRDVMFGEPGWSSSWSGTRELQELSNLMTPRAAVVVFSWLVSHVAHEQERTGNAVATLAPSDILVDDRGRARLRDQDGPGFLRTLKRWIGLESADAVEDSDARREDFWK